MFSPQLVNALVKYYACEPCRICGQMQLSTEAVTSVYVGYSNDQKSRTVHGACFDKQVPQSQWVLK